MNWQPLASGDPLAGEPQSIFQLVELLSNYAKECSSMASNVNNLEAIDWQSDAAEAFRLRQQTFPSKLNLVSTRLESTGTALQRFATQLEEIQTNASVCVRSAQQIQNQLEQVTPLANEQHRYNEQQDLEMLLGKPRVPWPGPNYMYEQSELEANLARVQSTFGELVREYQSAAQSCAIQLQQVSHDALANNMFSVFAHYGEDEVNDIKSELKSISEAAYYLAPGFARVMHDIANVSGIISMFPIPFVQEIAVAVFLVSSSAALGDDALLQSEHRLPGGWDTLATDGVQVVSAGLFVKAGDIVKASEVVPGISKTALGSGAPFLESFPKIINFESITSDVVGEGVSVQQWLPEHTALLHQILNDVTRDSMPLHPVLISPVPSL